MVTINEEVDLRSGIDSVRAEISDNVSRIVQLEARPPGTSGTTLPDYSAVVDQHLNANTGTLTWVDPPTGIPDTTAIGNILIGDIVATVPEWDQLASGTSGKVLTSGGLLTQPTWEDPADVLPTPSQGNIMIGDGADWVSTSSGAVNTVIRSDGTDIAYDLVIEDGTATGQIMVWDDAKNGIVAESLPVGDDAILIQSSGGAISFMQGSSGIPYYDSTGQPQFSSLPTAEGLLIHDGDGTFTNVPLTSEGLLYSDGLGGITTVAIPSGSDVFLTGGSGSFGTAGYDINGAGGYYTAV